MFFCHNRYPYYSRIRQYECFITRKKGINSLRGKSLSLSCCSCFYGFEIITNNSYGDNNNGNSTQDWFGQRQKCLLTCGKSLFNVFLSRAVFFYFARVELFLNRMSRIIISASYQTIFFLSYSLQYSRLYLEYYIYSLYYLDFLAEHPLSGGSPSSPFLANFARYQACYYQ